MSSMAGFILRYWQQHSIFHKNWSDVYAIITRDWFYSWWAPWNAHPLSINCAKKSTRRKLGTSCCSVLEGNQTSIEKVLSLSLSLSGYQFLYCYFSSGAFIDNQSSICIEQCHIEICSTNKSRELQISQNQWDNSSLKNLNFWHMNVCWLHEMSWWISRSFTYWRLVSVRLF